MTGRDRPLVVQGATKVEPWKQRDQVLVVPQHVSNCCADHLPQDEQKQICCGTPAVEYATTLFVGGIVARKEVVQRTTEKGSTSSHRVLTTTCCGGIGAHRGVIR